MSTSNTSGISQQRVNDYNPQEAYATRQKAYGTGQVDPSLQQGNIDWIRENQAEINAVLQGTSNLSPADQELLMEYYEYAKQVASGEIPSDVGDNSGSDATGPTTDIFGGRVGSNGNIVYDVANEGGDIRVGFLEEGSYEVYPGTGDVIIDAPGNGMVLSEATMAEDPSGRQVLKIVLKNEATGEEAVYLVHVNENTHVKINLANGQNDRSGIDPSLASVNSNDGELLLQVGQYESVRTTGVVEGTQPDEVEGNSRIWNSGNAVDYHVTEGSEVDKIFADTVNITVENRSQQVYVTKTGDHKYTIEIKDANGNTIRTIEADQVDQINFDGVDESNLFYRDATTQRTTTTQATPTTAPATGPLATLANNITTSRFANAVAANLSTNPAAIGFQSWADSPPEDDQITLNGQSSTEATEPVEVGGDSPTRTDEDTKTRTWDGSNFEIFTRGDGYTNNIAGRGEVRIHASSNLDEYHVVSYEDGKIVDRIYASEEEAQNAKSDPSIQPKETHIIDPMASKIIFDVAPNHIEFVGALGKSENPHEINTSNRIGAKLGIENVEGEITTGEESDSTTSEALNPNYRRDSKPTTVDDNRATYSQDRNVEIHSNLDDDVNVHEINAQGTVTIHPASQNSEIVSYYDKEGNIVVRETGVDKDGNSTTETYIIDAAKVDKVIIDADPSSFRISNLRDGPTMPNSIRSKIRLGEEANEASQLWPSHQEIYDNRSNNWNEDKMVDLINSIPRMDRSPSGEDWEEFESLLRGMNPEHANDALRQIMSSLRTLAGSDRVFEAWLDQIPSDVRRLMIAKLRADEPDQKEGRDRWTTSELADVLENSITD